MDTLTYGTATCSCPGQPHDARLIVLTGGPSAGKSETLRRAVPHLCNHVAILPEAASVLFRGGFPRTASLAGGRAAQRAIWHVQRQLEELVVEERRASVVLCDRGTLDGLAYWPGDPETYLRTLGTTQAAEAGRYAAVIHLQTAAVGQGYDRSNPLRIEDASEALLLDERVRAAWAGHPHLHLVARTADFDHKVARTLHVVRDHLAPCCQDHVLPAAG